MLNFAEHSPTLQQKKISKILKFWIHISIFWKIQSVEKSKTSSNRSNTMKSMIYPRLREFWRRYFIKSIIYDWPKKLKKWRFRWKNNFSQSIRDQSGMVPGSLGHQKTSIWMHWKLPESLKNIKQVKKMINSNFDQENEEIR